MAAGTLYLARHGETEWNRQGRLQGQTDVPLNDTGRAQARQLATRVRHFGLTHLGSSGLSRAQETARICAEELQVPHGYTDPALGERVYGAFEGKTRSELEATHAHDFAAWQADNRFTPPGAETYEAMVARMLAAAARAKQHLDATGGAMLLVSHGGAMRALIYGVTGEFVRPLPNGALIEVRFDDAGRVVHVEPHATS